MLLFTSENSKFKTSLLNKHKIFLKGEIHFVSIGEFQSIFSGNDEAISYKKNYDLNMKDVDVKVNESLENIIKNN